MLKHRTTPKEPLETFLEIWDEIDHDYHADGLPPLRNNQNTERRIRTSELWDEEEVVRGYPSFSPPGFNQHNVERKVVRLDESGAQQEEEEEVRGGYNCLPPAFNPCKIERAMNSFFGRWRGREEGEPSDCHNCLPPSLNRQNIKRNISKFIEEKYVKNADNIINQPMYLYDKFTKSEIVRYATSSGNVIQQFFGNLKNKIYTYAKINSLEDLSHIVKNGNFVIRDGEQQFKLSTKIDYGAFGIVCRGVNQTTGEPVAVKLENAITDASTDPKLLFREAEAYRRLQGGLAIPRVFGFYQNFLTCNVLVMELLGHNLETIFAASRRSFTMKTVLIIAEQMINALEFIHNHNLIHRDLKPENIMMSPRSDISNLYIIDFGFAEEYKHPYTKEHVPCSDDQNFVGTLDYASVNAHLFKQLSRRDDMESLGYILYYFLFGALPWNGFQNEDWRKFHWLIFKMKKEIDFGELARLKPCEFSNYLKLCSKLSFTEEPEYSLYRSMFKNVHTLLGHKNDGLFDWHGKY